MEACHLSYKDTSMTQPLTTTSLYVDCNSLWHAALNFAKENGAANLNPRLDYKRLIGRLTERFGPIAAFAYVMAGANVSLAGFATVLTTIGYEVQTWDRSLSRTPRIQVLTDILTDVDNGDADHVIIATQDPFFATPLAELKSIGKRITLASFGEPPEQYESSGFEHFMLGHDFLQAPK